MEPVRTSMALAFLRTRHDGLAGLLAPLAIGKKDLGGRAEQIRDVLECIQQRGEKSLLDHHVVVAGDAVDIRLHHLDTLV